MSELGQSCQGCECYLRCQQRDRCRCNDEFVHNGKCHCGQAIEKAKAKKKS